jgi:S1-C subfamily serine protease
VTNVKVCRLGSLFGCLLVGGALMAAGSVVSAGVGEARTDWLAERADQLLVADEPHNLDWVWRDGRLTFEGVADTGRPISIVFDRQTLLSTAVRLTLRTDARQCWLASGGAVVQLRLSAGAAHQLVLDADGQGPTLTLNGKTTDDQVGRWVRLCLVEKDPRVVLRLVGARQAIIEFDEPGVPEAPAANHSDDTALTLDSGAANAGASIDVVIVPDAVESDAEAGTHGEPGWAVPASAESELAVDRPSPLSELVARAEAGDTNRPRSTEEMIEQVKRAVFQLRRQGPDGGLIAVGTGVLVDPSGLAMTTDAAVRNGEVFAVLNADAVPLAVEVLEVDGALGLSLVRLEMPQGGTAFPHVPPHPRGARVGDEVWALGCSVGIVETVVPGRVTHVGDASVIPVGLPRAGNYPHHARWVAVAGHKVADDAGGPVVNQFGHLVAINTPLRDNGGGRFFALASTHVTGVLQAHRPRPQIFEPPTSDRLAADASDDPAGNEPREARFFGHVIAAPQPPLPRITVQQTTPAAVLQRVAQQYRDTHARRDTAARAGGDLVRALATAREGDPALADAFDVVRAAIDALAQHEPHTLTQRLHEVYGPRADAGTLNPGDPVLVSGDTLDPADLRIDAEGGLIIESRGILYLVLNPRVTDAAAALRHRLIAGGIVAGTTQRSGQRLVILQHGFIRPVQ